MTETKVKKSSDELAQDRTNLAYDRTALANDRTLMAWIRTSISLTSFGFTIYKFFEEIIKSENLIVKHTFFSPRIVGMILIGMGFFGLLFGYIQYKSDMKRLSSVYEGTPKSLTAFFAMMFLLLSLVLFMAALFRQ
jgi:putative membrane protein